MKGQTMAKVSVIVPIYNTAAYVRQCLESIASQTLDDIEVLCVDDCSTDGSDAICRQFAQRDRRFRYLRLEKNSGAAQARNEGIARATGEYLAFMDADDWYPADACLKLLYDAATAHDADLCAGAIDRFDQDSGEIIPVGPDEDHLRCFSFKREGWIEYRDWQYDYGFTRFIYRREFLARQGITFPRLCRHEDPVFLVRCLVAAGRFYAITDIVYRIRMGYKRMQFDERQIDDALEGISQVLAISYEHDLVQLRHWQKVLMRQYVVESKGILGEFFLKDLVREASQRVCGKAFGAVRKAVGKDDAGR